MIIKYPFKFLYENNSILNGIFEFYIRSYISYLKIKCLLKYINNKRLLI